MIEKVQVFFFFLNLRFLGFGLLRIMEKGKENLEFFE